MSSSDKLTGVVAATAVVATSALVANMFLKNKESEKGPIPSFLTDKKYESVVNMIAENLEDISNDSLYKIVRQLEFWTKENLSDEELVALTKRLIHVATWRKRPDFKVPTKRFGRTELQIPIVTCGSMRFQHTWMPDNLPITISKKKVLKTPSQENMLQIVLNCIKMGVNHIETARGYGTSEVQLMHALTTLIDRGDIKRSDFILQTKIAAGADDTAEAFQKKFEASWEHFKDLGYIDLLSFHCVSSPQQVENILDESDDGVMAALLEYKKQGKIKHIGFSSHGTAETILKMVESNKFDYVNLHYHFFGCYHAEGTPDTQGGHGLAAIVKKATELDMGIFQISPVDKGGHLYNPSATVCRLLGPTLNPIAFAANHAWQNGIHTSSVGFARPEDLDEILEAAELYMKPDTKALVEKAETSLKKHATEKLGKEWFEKGLLNVPSFYDESTLGVGIGHILWCYNLLHAFGMYEMAHARYDMLEKTNKWDHKKSFEENDKKMNTGNPARGYDEKVDLAAALAKHYDPEDAVKKTKLTHDLLTKATPKLSPEKKRELGWDDAYDLRPWHEFPDSFRATIPGVVLQNLTGGWFGSGGGPTKDDLDFASKLRKTVQDVTQS